MVTIISKDFNEAKDTIEMVLRDFAKGLYDESDVMRLSEDLLHDVISGLFGPEHITWSKKDAV